MEYKIGEVSKLTKVSPEMIRYYEKQGVLTPDRTKENNYRVYSTMDVFLIMEIVRYQSMNFSIKQISELLKDNYYNKYSMHLYNYHLYLNDEIEYKMMIKDRVKELAVRSNHIYLNINNFWIKKIPDLNLVYLLNANGDQYNDFEISEKNRKLLFEGDTMLFCESMVIFENSCDTWWYSIRKEISDKLNLTIKYEKQLEAQFCLCSIVDMGEVGTFNRVCLNNINQYIKDKKYKIIGHPRGIIIGRGVDQGRFRRLMEIQVPIEV